MELVPKMLRLPAKLNGQLIREAGERTAKTGQRVSVNQLIVEILEAHFRERDRRAGRR